MRTVLVVALVTVFSFILVGQAAAQGWDPKQEQIARGIAQGRSGNFKGTVESCNPSRNTCVVKTDQGATRTGNMTYASYQGTFDAAKQLKPGDKIMGQWQEVEGTIYATVVTKQDQQG